MKGKTFALLFGFSLITFGSQAASLNIAFKASPNNLDPHKSSSSVNSSLTQHVFESLNSMDNKPLLATSWNWDNATTLTVKVREGVKFHNGQPMTARDVIYSTCRMMHKFDGKNNVVTSSLSPVQDVVQIDDYTVQFTTEKPYPLLVQKLKYLAIMPVSLADVPEGLIKFDSEGDCGIVRYTTPEDINSGEAAIGTGPFKVESYTKDVSKLTRNDDYWGEASDWENVTIRTVSNDGARMAGLLSGDFDVIVQPTNQDLGAIKYKSDFKVTSAPKWRTNFIVLNNKNEPLADINDGNGNPLADVRVRKALSLAINRKEIVNKIFAGFATPANQLGPRFQDGAADLPELEYNPKKAKELLAEAGYPNGFKTKFVAPSDRYDNAPVVAQVIAQYWGRIGVEIELQIIPGSTFFKELSSGNVPTYLYEYGTPQGIGQLIYLNYAKRNAELGIGSPSLGKRTNYENDSFNKKMEILAVETNDAKSREVTKDAMVEIMNDMAGIPLYHSHAIWAHRSNIEMIPNPFDRTTAAYIKLKK